MGELINGRTPEEIKRELRWAVFTCGSINCEDCEYYESICSHTTDERLAPDALALIEHLEAKIPKWISVEERLPTKEDATDEGKVLCILSKLYGSMAGNCRTYDWDIVKQHPVLFSHWMSFPEPIKENELNKEQCK